MNVLMIATLKVLMIGNSFSMQMATALPPVAKNLGQDLDICSMFIGGCPISKHAENIAKPATKPYAVTWNYCGKANEASAPVAVACAATTNSQGRVVRWHGNVPALLRADKWDVVTVQQASHESWRPETYEPGGETLVKTIRELAPQAKILVQETWSYTPFDGRLKSWKITPDEMYEKLHAAYVGFAAKYGCEIIPTGAAVQEWRKRLPVKYCFEKGHESAAGDCCGSFKVVREKDSDRTELKGDKFHMNGLGNHLQALVWAAKLFGADVTACTYVPKVVKPEQAAMMRTIAMDVVRGQQN